MTLDEVREVIRLQISHAETRMNAHGITLNQMLVPPKKTSVIARTINKGRANDDKIVVWLVGQENSIDGYKIIMREDSVQFGLALRGFSTDEHLVLVGWHGDLISAFANM